MQNFSEYLFWRTSTNGCFYLNSSTFSHGALLLFSHGTLQLAIMQVLFWCNKHQEVVPLEYASLIWDILYLHNFSSDRSSLYWYDWVTKSNISWAILGIHLYFKRSFSNEGNLFDSFTLLSFSVILLVHSLWITKLQIKYKHSLKTKKFHKPFSFSIAADFFHLICGYISQCRFFFYISHLIYSTFHLCFRLCSYGTIL